MHILIVRKPVRHATVLHGFEFSISYLCLLKLIIFKRNIE